MVAAMLLVGLLLLALLLTLLLALLLSVLPPALPRGLLHLRLGPEGEHGGRVDALPDPAGERFDRAARRARQGAGEESRH